MDNPYKGIGGSYLVDPDTGEVTVLQSPAKQASEENPLRPSAETARPEERKRNGKH